MENIYMILFIKESRILMEYKNMKENIYLIKNGMEKDLMKKVILYMN